MSVRPKLATHRRQYWSHPTHHVFLHIGTPKTGTTSIQNFLGLEKEYLSRNGLAFCCSPNDKPNFKELFHASVAPSRVADMIVKKPKLGRVLTTWRVKRHIRRVIRNSPWTSLIASSEILSWLRHPSEIDSLRDLFPPKTIFTVILCVREKDDFLASYKRQLDAREIPYGTRQGQRNYVEKDSWLLDYGGILTTFESLTDDIRVIDYGKAKKSGQNIIETFCETIGMIEAPEPSTLLMLNKRSGAHLRQLPSHPELTFPVQRIQAPDFRLPSGPSHQ